MEQKQKAFRIRVEDTRDGTVDEYETNCFALATADKNPEGVHVNTSKGVNGNAYKFAGCAIALKGLAKEIRDELCELRALAAKEKVDA